MLPITAPLLQTWMRELRIILNLMAQREEECEAKGCEYFHEIENLEIEDFIKLIRNHPDKKDARGLIDAGGLLLNHKNEVWAKELKKFFIEEKKQGGPDIKAIGYLHKASEEEIKNGLPKEFFACLKLEDEGFHPIPFKEHHCGVNCQTGFKKRGDLLYF